MTTATHETWIADFPEGAMVGCSCGWKVKVSDAPEDYEGWTRLIWLLDQRDDHREENA